MNGYSIEVEDDLEQKSKARFILVVGWSKIFEILISLIAKAQTAPKQLEHVIIKIAYRPTNLSKSICRHNKTANCSHTALNDRAVTVRDRAVQ